MDGFYAVSRRSTNQLRPFQSLRAAIPISTTYWRILVTRTDTDQTSVSVGEMEMMANTSDTTDLCTGGTASVSSQYDVFHGGDKAVDDNTGSTWATAASAVPAWIQYVFASAKTINKVTIRSRAESGSTYGQTPREFTIQSSVDGGTTWIDEWSVTGQTGWGTGEVRTFARPGAA